MTGATRERVPPPIPVAVGVCLLAAVAYVCVRLGLFFPTPLVPLTYAIGMLLALWHRRRWLHWATAAGLALLGFIEVFFVLPANSLVQEIAAYAMVLTNIGVVAAVVDIVLSSRARLHGALAAIARANAELEASNEELAAREEEISSQNEELQQQAEELEQQSEELQQQSEELQHKGEELQVLHDEALTRESILEHLLYSATSEDNNINPLTAIEQLCEKGAAAFRPEPAAVLVQAVAGGHLDTFGTYRLDLSANREALTSRAAFAWHVVAQKRAACIEDLEQAPEVATPASERGLRYRSVLAAPITSGEEVVGVLSLYDERPRAWTEADFRAIAWLAAQAALVQRAIRLRLELDQRLQESDDASRRKTRFLAAVSHDVRTPANAISLLAEVIARTGSNPELQDQVPSLALKLRSNAKLLVELVSDVLDISRFDSGRVDLDESEFSLCEVIQAEVRQYQSVAEAGGLLLCAETPSASVWIRSDRMKLARVLGNLIGNALKFTDRGRVCVRCQYKPSGDVLVQVIDTGVGIPEEHQPHIFDEFYQIKNPERDRSKGSGLGLAICKRLVDALGCRLELASSPGVGSTFSITIPAARVVRVAALERHVPAQPRNRPLAGLCILLVEDHEPTRETLAQLLEQEGATVEGAKDGREALRMLGHCEPDVILLDLMLPDMDGREVLMQLQAERPSALKSVLAVSGDVSDARREEIARLGADELVAKPVEVNSLVAKILSSVAVEESGDGVESAA